MSRCASYQLVGGNRTEPDKSTHIRKVGAD